MGFSIVLNTADELRNRVWVRHIPHERQTGDPYNTLFIYLRNSWRDTDSPCLRFIDPYGQTVFNRLQMPTFIAEWEKISRLAETPEDQELLARVAALARRCRDEEGFYLRFIGD